MSTVQRENKSMESPSTSSSNNDEDTSTELSDEELKIFKERILQKGHKDFYNMSQRESTRTPDSESEDELRSSLKHYGMERQLTKDCSDHAATQPAQSKISSAGPSNRQTVAKIKSPPLNEPSDPLSSESDSEEDSEKKKTKGPIPGEYNSKDYENLDVNEEIKELFQYITKYVSQNLNLDFKFKPFVPDFIPAVGDIDAFLKVVPPDVAINGEAYQTDLSYLGLTVLDEPAATQSDPALLHLQLRASSVNVSHTKNLVIKKVDNIEKNSKTIDKWIKDISELHRTKSSPIVKYSDPMPELDDLMQEWPEGMENLLKTRGFPSYKLRGSLSDYVDIVCNLFDIPVYKNKIQSLHVLFSLYAAVKNSQLYKATSNEEENLELQEKSNDADQLVLE